MAPFQVAGMLGVQPPMADSYHVGKLKDMSLQPWHICLSTTGEGDRGKVLPAYVLDFRDQALGICVGSCPLSHPSKQLIIGIGVGEGSSRSGAHATYSVYGTIHTGHKDLTKSKKKEVRYLW